MLRPLKKLGCTCADSKAETWGKTGPLAGHKTKPDHGGGMPGALFRKS